MDEVEGKGKGGWLEEFENSLLRRLDETGDRHRARKIIETLCTGRTSMSPFNWDDPETVGNHENDIDPDIAAKIAASSSPAIMDYNARIARWGANPRRFPLLPDNEWAMVMFDPYRTYTDKDKTRKNSDASDET